MYDTVHIRSYNVKSHNKVIYTWMIIGAECHNVGENQGDVGANFHSTAQIDI